MRISLSLAVVIVALSPSAARAQTRDISRFTPEAAIADTTGHCRAANPVGLHEGEHGVQIVIGASDSARRIFGVVWDSAGHLARYSDAVGDLRGPNVESIARGARTTVMIDFAHDRALLVNESRGTSHGTMAKASAALDAPRLGPPKALLERLHRECGAPAL